MWGRGEREPFWRRASLSPPQTPPLSLPRLLEWSILGRAACRLALIDASPGVSPKEPPRFFSLNPPITLSPTSYDENLS